jgi:hypothetical protein
MDVAKSISPASTAATILSMLAAGGSSSGKVDAGGASVGNGEAGLAVGAVEPVADGELVGTWVGVGAGADPHAATTIASKRTTALQLAC